MAFQLDPLPICGDKGTHTRKRTHGPARLEAPSPYISLPVTLLNHLRDSVTSCEWLPFLSSRFVFLIILISVQMGEIETTASITNTHYQMDVHDPARPSTTTNTSSPSANI